MGRKKVSVICVAYNHEKYIEKCLDSMLVQKTSFEYEIIVHDDASTDRTSEIIKKYSESYPDIIKPIFQKENQYSKNSLLNVFRDVIVPMLEGEYVALCDGDDFWCDERKIEKQVKALEQKHNCFMCTCKTQFTDCNGELLNDFFPKYKWESRIIESDEMVRLALTDYSFHTSGYMFLTEKFVELINENWLSMCRSGDVVYQLYFACKGDVYYINDIMSCYRLGVTQSWSEVVHSNYEERKKHNLSMIELYKKYNQYTDEKYSLWCDEAIRERQYILHIIDNHYKEVIKPYYKKAFRKESLKARIYIYLMAIAQVLRFI